MDSKRRGVFAFSVLLAAVGLFVFSAPGWRFLSKTLGGTEILQVQLVVPVGFDAHVCFMQSPVGDGDPSANVWAFKLASSDEPSVRVPSCERMRRAVRFVVHDDAGDPIPFYVSGETVPARGRFARLEDGGECCLRLRVSAPPRRSGADGSK